jgi:two-component system, OmpR family, sensor histidine kinase MtrB
MPSLVQVRPSLRPTGHTVVMPDATRRRRSLGLRARVTLFFSIAGLVLSIALAAITYTVARTSFINQRKDSALQIAESNANSVRLRLRNSSSLKKAIEIIQTDGDGVALLAIGDREASTVGSSFLRDDLPAELLAEIIPATGSGISQSGRARQLFTFKDRTYVVIGVTITEFDAGYFETFPV